MVKVHLYHSVSSAIPSLIDTIFKYLLDKLNKMKFLLCNGPISIKTSDGKTLNVNWDVGHPDKNTIKTMFDVSIKEDGDNCENTTPLQVLNHPCVTIITNAALIIITKTRTM